ncbi:Eco47II family restriction endonuclease [Candidatus Kaiserbacteria bacterium]|nr:Eco47II family restriction endonuclease [Candidatus Kaiserbacteria bacterium]
MAYLKFIPDKNLIAIVGKVVEVIIAAENNADEKLYKNVIDPFSALFHGITKSMSYKEWLTEEKTRQIQKTMQNAIGNFHQEIIGSVRDWEDLGAGGGLDVINKKKRIIAEMKNKFNTTKGNHRVEIYDAIEAKIKSKEYTGYTGYYVEVISQGRNVYDNLFTPPDNKIKKNRPENKKIRVIDGVSFYALTTGRPHALQELFQAIPEVLSDNYKYKLNKKDLKQYFSLFEKAFSTE